MSNILAYPAIPEVSEADLLIISDISEDGNPTRTVSVQALVGGSTAPLGLTVNGTSGAATLIDNILNIPIYTGGGGGGGGGTVTNVSYSTNINAFAASVTNSSSSPDITLTLNGGSVGQFLRQDGEWATVPSGGGTMSQWNVDDGGAGGFQVANNNTVTVGGSTKISVSTNVASKSITWTHKDTARTDTTSTASPAAGATFTVVDSITQDATGHPTAVNVKTVTMPASGGGGVNSVAGTTPGTSIGTPIVVDPTTGSVLVKSMAYNGTTNVGHVPTGGGATTFLRGDGTWVVPSGGGAGTTYDLASAQDGSNVDITLTPSTGAVDTVQLTAGTNITLTDNGSNNITIDAAGGGGGGGVSSIGLSTDITAFTILNSPITTAGTLQINKNGGVAGQYLNQDGTWQYGIFKKDANNGIYVSDRTVANYGAIGANSFDASFSTNATGVNGAVGDHSAAFGENNKVTQDWAFVTGKINTLSTAKYSFMFGKENTGNAASSIIGGWENYVNVTTQTDYHSLVVLGYSNIVSTPAVGAAVIGKSNVANSGFSGCMFGTDNQANSSRTYIFGSDNTIGNASGNSVIGAFNNVILGNSATIVGNGNDVDNATHDSGRNAILGYDITVSGKGIVAIGDTMDCTVDDAVYIGSSQAHGGNIGTTRVIMPSIANMASFADDTAAAAGGIVVGELYRDGSAIKIRVT